jgi:hypothetical protein
MMRVMMIMVVVMMMHVVMVQGVGSTIKSSFELIRSLK